MDKIQLVENFGKVVEQNEKDAQEALRHVYAAVRTQPSLFEEYAEQKPYLRRNNEGYTLADETYARLRACGYKQVDAWRMSHPASKANISTMYSKASILEKKDKIRTRISFWKNKISQECLMSTTELFARITEIARERGKEQLDALKLIGQIHGVFKAEKDLPGSADNPLVVKSINYADLGPQEREKQQ